MTNIEVDQNLLKKVEEIKKGGPFLMTVSTFDKKTKGGKELKTFLFTNNFPSTELNKVQKKIASLIKELWKVNK